MTTIAVPRRSVPGGRSRIPYFLACGSLSIAAMQVSSKQLANILAAGTGLDLAGRRILGANIAGAEIQPVHVHVNLDGREVAAVVTKQQARSSRRTAKQTSGFRG